MSAVELVASLTAEGRVTVDDLRTAAEWCRAYEFTPGDELGNPLALARVAEWLDREAQRRADEATVRELVRTVPGATPKQARAALLSARVNP